MKGKKVLIMGLANKMSIAYGIAKALREHGADLAFSYQGEILEKRVRPLAKELGSDFLIDCDVINDDDLDQLFTQIEKKWGKLDCVVHAIAFANKEELKGQYVNTTRSNFLNSMDISCYSFTSIAKRAAVLMKNGGSMVTLTYYGAEKVIPNYNVMGVAKAALEASVRYIANDLGPRGIRVNAISAGPIKTLAASGIGDFKTFLKISEETTPLRMNVSQDQVGSSALYLLSDLASGVTGEIHYVDAGYNIVGMSAKDLASGE